MNPASSSPQPPQAAVLMMQDNTTSRDPTDLPAFTADESAPTLAVGNSAAGNDTGRALVDENVPVALNDNYAIGTEGSDVADDAPPTSPVITEHTGNDMVVDRTPTSPPNHNFSLHSNVLDGSNPNVSDRFPPNPANMVRPTIFTNRKYYTVTFGRSVGITTLLSAALDYQRGVSGASSCSFLLWDDAFEYYAASYHGGHVHIANATAERRLRGIGRAQAGDVDHPIFVPSTTSTLIRAGQTRVNINPAIPATPTRQTRNLGTDRDPIYVSSALPTPQIQVHQGPPTTIPDPSTPSGRRFLVIDATLKKVAAENPAMPPPSQPRGKVTSATRVIKGKHRPKFITTNEDEDDENTITGYFAPQGSGAGPSRLA